MLKLNIAYECNDYLFHRPSCLACWNMPTISFFSAKETDEGNEKRFRLTTQSKSPSRHDAVYLLSGCQMSTSNCTRSCEVLFHTSWLYESSKTMALSWIHGRAMLPTRIAHSSSWSVSGTMSGKWTRSRRFMGEVWAWILEFPWSFEKKLNPNGVPERMSGSRAISLNVWSSISQR